MLKTAIIATLLALTAASAEDLSLYQQYVRLKREVADTYAKTRAARAAQVEQVISWLRDPNNKTDINQLLLDPPNWDEAKIYAHRDKVAAELNHRIQKAGPSENSLKIWKTTDLITGAGIEVGFHDEAEYARIYQLKKEMYRKYPRLANVDISDGSLAMLPEAKARNLWYKGRSVDLIDILFFSHYPLGFHGVAVPEIAEAVTKAANQIPGNESNAAYQKLRMKRYRELMSANSAETKKRILASKALLIKKASLLGMGAGLLAAPMIIKFEPADVNEALVAQ